MIDKKNTKISILLLIILMVNIVPTYFTSIKIVSRIFSILKLVTFGIGIYIYIKNNRLSKIVILISLFYIIYIFATYLNNGINKSLILLFTSGLTLIMVSEVYIRKNINLFLNTCSLYFFVIICMNLLTVIIFPDGLYDANNINPHYLLGHRNNAIEFILPGLCIEFLRNFTKKDKVELRTYVLVIVSLCTIVLTWSANALVALSIVYAYLILPVSNKFLQRITNYWTYMGISIAMFFSFVVFRMQYLFSWLIVDVLHKSLDFTDRTGIWDSAIKYIKKSPLIGYGLESMEVKRAKIGHGNSAHNYYLDLLYNGGVIMLTIFITMLVYCGIKIGKNKNSKISKVFIAIMAGYFIISFATPLHRETICLLFFVMTCISKIEEFIKFERLKENE